MGENALEEDFEDFVITLFRYNVITSFRYFVVSSLRHFVVSSLIFLVPLHRG